MKKDLIVGTGAEAKTGDKVTVNYVGVLYNGGKEFDSSWKRKRTVQLHARQRARSSRVGIRASPA